VEKRYNWERAFEDASQKESEESHFLTLCASEGPCDTDLPHSFWDAIFMGHVVFYTRWAQVILWIWDYCLICFSENTFKMRNALNTIGFYMVKVGEDAV